MSCVWTSLITALKLHITPHVFLTTFTKNNIETPNVIWNEKKLTSRNHERK